ncbi:ABC-type dipeptide/oligopeptide/nickel transport system, permease component [Frankia torreyi]|uniref:ABC-type dipeptide/oligopeptide/nickel transport system, permease component n=1 Tax=Frankia torreyi TaxID=1856 RepID=A0A0D8BBJ7_9ACTN|nr:MULTISPECIES: ABC transporter permease [Frankia]KJE20737.1 ABC-type dipeptide/oligopeptide/nickel transport system, permease component [Frankia torreyi]KQM03053.1 ABC-type dipeptide/oligopeptide/nickel transport system, permease component [Frankia sp. CpI1-P]
MTGSVGALVRGVWGSRSGRLGAVLSGLVVVAAVVSLVWTPYDPSRVDPAASWAPVGTAHWFGADRLGRDLFSQVLVGARTTLVVAVAATAIAAAVGVGLALLATLPPRLVAEGVAHLVDVLLAFPVLLLAMVLAAVYGGSRWTAIVAIGVGAGIGLGRVTRGEVRRVLGADYVLAARAAGAGTGRIVRRHVLPNIAPTVWVQLSLILGLSVLTEAALSYLGFGTPPPTPSWGRMLSELQPYLTLRPLTLLWPGLAVVLTVLGFNLLGDGLREAGDPRLRERPAGGSDGAPRTAAAATTPASTTPAPPAPAPMAAVAPTAGSAPRTRLRWVRGEGRA